MEGRGKNKEASRKRWKREGWRKERRGEVAKEGRKGMGKEGWGREEETGRDGGW